MYYNTCEVEELMKEAYDVGALVEWKVVARIREITKERQLIRYHRRMLVWLLKSN